MGRIQNSGEKEGQINGNRETQENQIIKRNRRAKERRSLERKISHHRTDKGKIARKIEKNRGAVTRGADTFTEDDGTETAGRDIKLKKERKTEKDKRRDNHSKQERDVGHRAAQSKGEGRGRENSRIHSRKS